MRSVFLPPRPWLTRPRFAGGLALIFAFIFFGLNARTGWTFFGWYAYPLAPALIAATAFMCERWGSRLPRRAAILAVTVLVALTPVLAVRYYIEHGPRWSVDDNPLLAMSYELARRMQGQQGLFAMGAIAGVVTYVLDKPVFQFEGIAADHRLLEHIRRQAPLEDVLHEYRVDYLIVSTLGDRLESRDGCYIVTQPNAEWAGHRTAKMRGEICAEPLVQFTTPRGPNPWSRFSPLKTLGWDLRGATWRRPRAH